MVKRFNCHAYENGKVPPCCAFLENVDPIIKDGKLIYKNENRLFFFISTIRDGSSPTTILPETTSPITETPTTEVNLQVSLPTFLVGLYINQIQLGIIKYNEKCNIHYDKASDDFIHAVLKKAPEVEVDYTPKIAALISNNNAVLPLFTYAVNITALNFYILFVLNRLEMNPGLFFGNNSFATSDPINFKLASLNLQFPF